MTYRPFDPSYQFSLPVLAVAVVGFCGYARKIVKAISDFVIFVFQEAGRTVREYHKVADEVRREKNDRGPRVRGRAPHPPARRISSRSDAGQSGARRAKK